MSARFPGAPTVDDFWENLRDGIESVTRFSRHELTASGLTETALDHPNFVPVGSVLEDIDLFDAGFFGISPREAEALDPQHRIFLETAWHALEDSGHDPSTFWGRIGVYGGCATSSYLPLLQENPGFMELLGHLQVYIGNDKDYLTSRVSYALDLKGPSFNIQTACSTSLLTVAVASDQLVSRQCDMALAGGVCIRVPQKAGYYFEPGGIYSPDGHCRVFDEDAGGVVFGNGVGIVVLKRLSDAIADHDSIYAVIRGWAVNNDGSGKASYAAPSLEGQADVITRAHKMAGFDAESISYVEAHGTGTTVGDPIEVAALTKAFRTSTQRKNYCAIGSVKTNVGHLDPAAGIAGLIKTVLALRNRQIPPTLNCETLNPGIDFSHSPFYVNHDLAEWSGLDGERRAGVSAFGIGGTNVHVVLEEAPPLVRRDDGERRHVMVLSAKSPYALESAITNLSDHLDRTRDLRAGDVAYTLQYGRRAWNHRCAAVFESLDDLRDLLETRDARRLLIGTETSRDRMVSFMFSGQGSQYVNMARDLYEYEPRFRVRLDQCLDILRSHIDHDLRNLLFPDDDARENASRGLTQTGVTQPVLFALEYSLAELWREWGVEPNSMVGHSIGEYVAACIAEVFSLEDGLALVCERGRLMQGLPAGSMLAIPLPEADVAVLLPSQLDIASVNETSSCVVSGATEEIDELEQQLSKRDVLCRRLQTSHAFHSRMMDPILETFRKKVRQVNFKPPCIPFLSNVTGTWITTEEATDPDYWVGHIRRPVRFVECVGQLLADSDRVVVEVGPGQTLSSFARRHPDWQSGHIALSSLPHPQLARPDSAVILESLARLWTAGVPVDWARVDGDGSRCRARLPVYPFDRRRYWALSSDGPTVSERPPLEKCPEIENWFYRPDWKESPTLPVEIGKMSSPWLVFRDHGEIGDEVISHLRGAGHRVVDACSDTGFGFNGETSYEIDVDDAVSFKMLFTELRKRRQLPRRILCLWGTDSKSCSPMTGVRAGLFSEDQHLETEDKSYYGLLHIAQALTAIRVHHDIDVVVATRGAHLCPGDIDVSPERALVVGACKAVPQEYPNLRCRNVDIELVEPSTQHPSTAARDLIAEFGDPEMEPVVAIRGGRRWVPIYQPVQIAAPTDLGLLRNSGVYLITGGLGNIGLTLAEYLVHTVRAKVVLMGRTKFPDKEDWESWQTRHDPDERIARTIERLQALEGLGGEIVVRTGDVADVDCMSKIVSDVISRYGSLNGVIHAAGELGESGFFSVQEANRELCSTQFRAKIAGTSVLRNVLSNVNMDFVLLLSSVSSVLAGLGYVGYAAANIFMDTFAGKIGTLSDVPWISLNLDTWQDDRNNPIGEDASVLCMAGSEGIEVVRRVLASAIGPQIIVSTGTLQSRIDQWINIESLRSAQKCREGDSDHLHPRPESDKAYLAPRNEIEQETAGLFEEILGVSRPGVIDSFFMDLGGTSLLGTQLIARLRQRFQVDIPLRRFLEGPTISELAAIIESERLPTSVDSGGTEVSEE
jgi:acyl transferase domain-containing protein